MLGPGPMLGQKPSAIKNSSGGPESPFTVSVMLWTVFADLPFEQRLQKVAEAGYTNVELVREYEKWTEADFRRINAKRKELAIHFDCIAGLKHGVSVPDHRQALLDELRNTLPIMEKLDCPKIILLSGDTVPGMSREAQHQCCIETLKAAAEIVQGKIHQRRAYKAVARNHRSRGEPAVFLNAGLRSVENCPGGWASPGSTAVRPLS